MLHDPQRGVNAVHVRMNCYVDLHERGLLLLRRLDNITAGWSGSASVVVHSWSFSVQAAFRFIPLLAILIEEEILDWRAQGQWHSGPDESVKRELVKVHKINWFKAFINITRWSLLLENKLFNQPFEWRREIFTLKCLLPGGWVSGSIINTFIEEWQPLHKMVLSFSISISGLCSASSLA